MLCGVECHGLIDQQCGWWHRDCRPCEHRTLVRLVHLSPLHHGWSGWTDGVVGSGECAQAVVTVVIVRLQH